MQLLSNEPVVLGARIRIGLQVTDDDVGTQRADVYYRTPRGQWRNTVLASRDVNGQPNEVNYEIKESDDPGTWQAMYVYLQDNSGASRYVYDPRYQGSGNLMDLSLIDVLVENDAFDSVPPTLQSSSLITSPYQRPATTTQVSILLSDDKNRITSAYLYYRNPAYGTRQSSVSGYDSLENPSRLDVNLPVAGSWRIYYFYFQDAKGNSRQIYDVRECPSCQGALDFSTLDVIVDGTAPSTTVQLDGTEGEGGWFRSDIAATLLASDTGGAGVDKIEYVIGDESQSWLEYTEPVQFSGQQRKLLRVRTWDRAGNVSNLLEVEIKIDATRPRTFIVSSDPSISLSSASREPLLIEGVAIDEGGAGVSRVAYSVDTLAGIEFLNGEADCVGCGGNSGVAWFTQLYLPPGVFIVRFESYDLANNASETVSVQVVSV